MEALTAIVREALVVTGALCFPVLVLATIVGSVIAVLQAATQVQEQTLTLLPKMLAVGCAIAFGGAFGMQLCASLLRDAVAALPAIVRAGP